MRPHSHRVTADSNSKTAAIITKYKPPDAEKPIIRPYTPVSDEGKLYL